jgi:hypothetical protein
MLLRAGQAAGPSGGFDQAAVMGRKAVWRYSFEPKAGLSTFSKFSNRFLI